jgi:hypothetical protein
VTVFIDSNIPMYVAGAEHPNRAAADRFLERVRSREVAACTSTEVLQEILHRYSSVGKPAVAGRIYSLFVDICPAVFSVTLADTDRARDLLVTVPGIAARDAIHAAVMLNHNLEWIATFDAHFDRVPGISRLPL